MEWVDNSPGSNDALPATHPDDGGKAKRAATTSGTLIDVKAEAEHEDSASAVADPPEEEGQECKTN